MTAERSPRPASSGVSANFRFLLRRVAFRRSSFCRARPNETPELERALAALSEEGIDRSRIMVFSGDEGIRAIDPKGRYHGLLGRLTRTVQSLGEELEHMQRYEEKFRRSHSEHR